MRIVAWLNLIADVAGPWVTAGCVGYGFWSFAGNSGLTVGRWPLGLVGWSIGWIAGKLVIWAFNSRAGRRGR